MKISSLIKFSLTPLSLKTRRCELSARRTKDGMCACAVRVCVDILVACSWSVHALQVWTWFCKLVASGKRQPAPYHTTRHGTAQRWKIGRKEKADEAIKTKHWPLTFTTFIDCDRQTAMQIVNYDNLISSPLSACSLLSCVSTYVRRKNLMCHVNA